jgi:hypothetical protein
MGDLALKLADLVEDILRRILMLCDIYTVLSVSQVSPQSFERMSVKWLNSIRNVCLGQQEPEANRVLKRDMDLFNEWSGC